MTKDEMVQFALKSDDNVENTMWRIYQQGRADAIDDVERELLDKGFIFTQHALEVWREIAEQLKESK